MNSKLATPLKFFKATLLTGFCLLILGGCSQKSTTDMKAMDGKTVEDVLKTLGKPYIRVYVSTTGRTDPSMKIPQQWFYRCKDGLDGKSKFAQFILSEKQGIAEVEFQGIDELEYLSTGRQEDVLDTLNVLKNRFRLSLNVDTISRNLDLNLSTPESALYNPAAFFAEIGSEVKIGN